MKFLFISLLLLFTQFLSAKDFKGAEYRTKTSFLYGRFEVKIKSPGKEGILCSFFTYYDGGGGIEFWNEIDIEIMGRYNNQVQFNTITPGQVNHVRHEYVDFDPSLDFHTYAFEWAPTYVSWFIDGVEVAKQTGAHIEALSLPQKLMMNIWNPAFPNWAGKWNVDILPAFAYYDSVKYYAYTPGSGNYGTGNNFTFTWLDPMDSWNTSRWDKATHTFAGNNCDFIPQNAVFTNNTLALCLTNAVNIGHVDVTKPVPLWARNNINKVSIYFTEMLDQATATNSGNYIIGGVTVNSAVLKEDKRTVELSVSGIVPGNSYSILMLNIKDLYGNTMAAKALSLINAAPLTFPIKINVGGPSRLGYLPDKEFFETSEYGYMEGSSTTYGGFPIANTDEDSVYLTERNGAGCYYVRVANGNYKVKLMFAENYFTAAGKRIFDLLVQGKVVINNLDIFQRVGSKAAFEYTADNVIVTDGILKINFGEEVDKGLLNALIITQNSTGSIEGNEIPSDMELYQNFPNPFNGATNFTYKLNKDQNVDLRIFNINGEKVTSYSINGQQGINNFYWNGKDSFGKKLTSGVYFYTLNGESFNQTKKLIILN